MIINIFKNNNAIIKYITNNISINLLLKIDKSKHFEINLLYYENKYKEDIINNEINKKLNSNNTIESIFLNDNKNIIEIVKDSYSNWRFDNTFCVFKSFNNFYYLIYANQQKSIISYDLINNKRINEIKKAHGKFISNFRHYLDKRNKRDLILSISCEDCNLKLWNIYNFECLLNLTNIYISPFLNSVCFLNYDNNNYILTSNCNWSGISGPIKIFDFNGNKIKEINNSNDNTLFIDTYYDSKLSKIYILTANKDYVKSYDYSKNIIYHKYDDNDYECHRSIIIYENDNIMKLVESSQDGQIRIWDFHSGVLLKKIYIYIDDLIGICLYKNKYLFVGCIDGEMKLIELNKGIIIKNLKYNDNDIITIKKIFHPTYGECLIVQNILNGQIMLLMIKNILSDETI